MTNNKEQKIPKQVVRFYGKTYYALECIALKQITFLHLDKLNDPFEMLLENVTDFDDNYVSLLEYVEKHHLEHVASFKARLSDQGLKEFVAGFSRRMRVAREAAFVFSTSAVTDEGHPRDNLYMWGHYGNGHRGVAIEFNAKTLSDSIRKLGKQDSDEPPLFQMNYDKEMPKIKCEDIFEFMMNAKPDTNNLESYGPGLYSTACKIFCYKGEVWKKENEWRLVWENDETKLKILRHDLPDNAITAVYLGCRIAEQEQSDFIHKTQRNFPRASVFRAKIRKGEEALDFEELI